MKSTGEVMGISEDFGIALREVAAGRRLSIPTTGTVFISVNDYDKAGVLPHARELHEHRHPHPRPRGHRRVPERARRDRGDGATR